MKTSQTAQNDDLAITLMTLTKKCLLQIAANQGLEPDYQAINVKFKATYVNRFNAILDEVRKDAQEADLFGGLQHSRIDPLTKTVANVSITHGCVQYAKELLGIKE